MQCPPGHQEWRKPPDRPHESNCRNTNRALPSSLDRHVVVLGSSKQGKIRLEELSGRRTSEQILGQHGKPSLGDLPTIHSHGPTGVVNQQGSAAGTTLRQAVTRHPYPAMPVLTGHQLGIFGKAVAQEQVCLLYTSPSPRDRG